MMNQARPFEISNVGISSLTLLKDVSCQKKGPMVRPCIPFGANIDWITIGKDN
jgi:hypothetical protein